MNPLALLLFSFFALTHATEPVRFDTALVHRIYMEGEFEKAINLVESALENGVIGSHSDSVFAYKHLGVMYTAKYETREIGKRYMYQLLYIEPTARIMDMYASDMIYMIFKNIQEEVAITRGRPKVEAQEPEAKRQTEAALGAKRRSWPYWVGGMAAIGAGLGVAAYLLMERDPAPGNDYAVH